MTQPPKPALRRLTARSRRFTGPARLVVASQARDYAEGRTRRPSSREAGRARGLRPAETASDKLLGPGRGGLNRPRTCGALGEFRRTRAILPNPSGRVISGRCITRCCTSTPKRLTPFAERHRHRQTGPGRPSGYIAGRIDSLRRWPIGLGRGCRAIGRSAQVTIRKSSPPSPRKFKAEQLAGEGPEGGCSRPCR